MLKTPLRFENNFSSSSFLIHSYGEMWALVLLQIAKNVYQNKIAERTLSVIMLQEVRGIMCDTPSWHVAHNKYKDWSARMSGKVPIKNMEIKTTVCFNTSKEEERASAAAGGHDPKPEIICKKSQTSTGDHQGVCNIV